MHENANLAAAAAILVPWNKGKLIGAKPPLRQKHVWAIRGMLQNERNRRDLAMFNLAIDSKLRGCDVIAIRVDDVAPNGYAVDRATVRQRKTGRPVRFELTENTRQAIDSYLKFSRKKPGEFLFTGRRSGQSMTPRQYGRLVSNWLIGIGLDPHIYGTHSLRRTKATSYTVALAICARCSFYWSIRRSRAPCAIWGLRSTTLSPSRNKSTSDLPGQSGTALPPLTSYESARS